MQCVEGEKVVGENALHVFCVGKFFISIHFNLRALKTCDISLDSYVQPTRKTHHLIHLYERTVNKIFIL